MTVGLGAKSSVVRAVKAAYHATSSFLLPRHSRHSRHPRYSCHSYHPHHPRHSCMVLAGISVFNDGFPLRTCGNDAVGDVL